MFGSLFHSTSVPALQEVLAFTQARHELLAGNLANVDTPDYQVRDLSVGEFQKRLRQALEAPPQPQVWSQGYDGPAPVSRDAAMREVRESLKSVLRHDGSNVALEQQVAEMTKNQSLHNLAASLISAQFRLLQTAVSERV